MAKYLMIFSKLRLLCLFLIITCCFLAYFSNTTYKTGGSSRSSIVRPTESPKTSGTRKITPKLTQVGFLPENAEAIVKARDKLKALELERIRFCSQREDDKNIYYEFVIERPKLEEQRKIFKICNSVKGSSNDWFSGNAISWQQKLFDEYSLSREYSYCAISVTWAKDSTTGDYSIVGIQEEEFGYDENGNPCSKDGKVNIIRLGASFKTDKIWRFSHILEVIE